MKIAYPTAEAAKEHGRVSEALMGSIRYLFEVTGSDLVDLEGLQNFRPSWRTHGLYHASIRAIEADLLPDACDLLCRSIRDGAPKRAFPDIKYLVEPDCVDAMQIIRGELALHADRVIGVGYASPSAMSNNMEIQKLNEGLDLLRAAAPAFYSEYCDLVDQVLLTGEDDGVHVRSASSFNLFGLVMIWADPIHTPAYYLQQIVHEVAHLRLFMVNIEDALVLNDPNHRFKAPFRDDERPMLGIFHAYFVLARMVLALRNAKLQAIDSIMLGDIENKLRRSEDRFHNTAVEIRRHGSLTAVGQAIYDDCKAAVGTPMHSQLRQAN